MTDLAPLLDLDAERSVLGAMLAAVPEALEAVPGMQPSDFGHPVHALVFGAVRDLYIAGKPIELVSVAGRLHDLRLGQAELTVAELSDAWVSGAAVSFYVKRLHELSHLRRMNAAAREVLALVIDGRLEYDDRVSRFTEKVFEALDTGTTRQGLADLETIAGEVLDRAYRIDQDGESSSHGVLTGFPSLDALTGGLAPGRLVVYGARSGDGKSTNAGDFALAAARAGAPVLMAALEATRLEVFLGLLWKASGLRPALVQEGAIPPLELEIALKELRGLPIVIESGRFRLPDLLALIRRARMVRGVRLVVVDYVQLVSNPLKGQTRATELAGVSAALKQAAMDLEVCILACAQLNKGPEDREGPPQLRDIRESESIAHDADQVVFLSRPDRASAGSAPFLTLAKNRHGRTAARIPLAFDAHRNRYREAGTGPGQA